MNKILDKMYSQLARKMYTRKNSTDLDEVEQALKVIDNLLLEGITNGIQC